MAIEIMFKQSSQTENSNFWISYADLMAGLLFVFILLIGAIIVKSSILKDSLKEKESTLEVQSDTLKTQEEILKEQSENIEDKSETIHIKDYEINKLRNLLAKRKQALNESQQALIVSKESLTLKSNEIEKLNQLLLAQNTKIDRYSDKVILLQNLTSDYTNTIEYQNDIVEEYKGKVLVLSSTLTKQDEKLKLNDAKLLQLLKALDNRQTKYDDLLTKLQAQKAQIKSLTGIKLKVIAELKSALGNKINIDKESGSLRLSSSILFDKGSAQLKDSSKSQLKSNFIEYVDTLISNKNISDHLDKIIIEGHTDSDGGYLYNLSLSQKRAYAVMNYLLTLDYIKKNNIKTKLVASGRSYLDAIKINGVEDKDASRRIEVKFRLKNEDAMYEIERILDAD
ncbi:OmpA family protein [Sulfurovum sp. bin170]|uniref:OmpA family protein n=1 Tax=Sulfurovum sp. bin170 TaxID=2695268 RepID=UPI0021062F8F|nr:OmpA family protein [Sulfurovum sp. bin170]